MAEPVHEESCKCSWDKDKTVLTLRIAACLGNIAVGIYCVFDLLLSVLNVITIVMDIYLLVLSFFCLLAELRFISVIRSFSYIMLKWVYFLTQYTGRGLFYFFMGTLMLDGAHVSSSIVGVIMMIVGLLWIIVSRWYGLEAPKDKQVPEKPEEKNPAPTKNRTMPPQPVAQTKSPVEEEYNPPAFTPHGTPKEVPEPQRREPSRPAYPYQVVEEHPNPFASTN